MRVNKLFRERVLILEVAARERGSPTIAPASFVRFLASASQLFVADDHGTPSVSGKRAEVPRCISQGAETPCPSCSWPQPVAIKSNSCWSLPDRL